MKKRKKVSIIVPCYKTEKYIPKCLASLMGQTFNDYEIICVNDGSPDGTLGILKKWQRNYPDRILIIDKKNEGLLKARWDGIKLANGEYIGFLDSDDYVEPDYIERLYDAAIKTRADIAVCGFSRIDSKTGKVLSREFCDNQDDFLIQDDPGRLVGINSAAWNKLYKASLLKNAPKITITPQIAEDVIFNWLIYLKSEGRMTFVPKSLVNYLIRRDSLINNVSNSQVYLTYRAFLEVKSTFLSSEASEKLEEALDATAFLHLGISLNYRLSCGNKKTIKDTSQYIKQCTTFLDNYFPTWRHSPFINYHYACAHGRAFKRLLIVNYIYKYGLLPLFFNVYNSIINNLNIDIKW